MKLTYGGYVIESAGVGPGHPKEECDRCGKQAVKDIDGYTDLVATCTATEYLTLCEGCYRKAGNSVR